MANRNQRRRFNGFDVIDDTYIVQIPSIIKLKTELDKLPKDKVIENFNVKSRFRVSTQ
jgi:hypothetical protein